MLTKHTVTLVLWKDSSVRSEQSPLSDLPALTRIETVGFLLFEDEERIVLTRDLVGEAEHRDTIAIPRVAVFKILRREMRQRMPTETIEKLETLWQQASTALRIAQQAVNIAIVTEAKAYVNLQNALQAGEEDAN